MSAVAFVVHIPWPTVAYHLVVPHIVADGRLLDRAWWPILGTTISPYLFFWQAEEEAEETKEAPRREAAGARARSRRPRRSGASGSTPIVGMALSNLIALFDPHHHGGDPARPRHHRHPDLVAGGARR